MNPFTGTVSSTEWLTPSMVRVNLTGERPGWFSPTEFTDQYVNALFVPDDAPYAVPSDIADLESIEPRLRPRARRFTVRSWDPATQTLSLDFVAHGDVGFAGRWAQNAVPGDRLEMLGPSGNYYPNPDADWYLFAGDESALPAIAASLEVIPAGRRCVACIVVDAPEHEMTLTPSGEAEILWLHRSTAPDPDQLLASAIKRVGWSEGVVDVFVHGEAGEVRAVRKYLLGERAVAAEHASISPYWRRNHDDEAWRKVKRQWLAEQAADL